MSRLRIGVRLESLGLPLRKALQQASSMGVAGVQFDAVGDLSPTQLSDTGRRELRYLLRSYNLELTALGCPLRRSLDTLEDQEPRIEQVRRALTLSCDLEARRTLVQAGRMPADDEPERLARMTEALLALSQHGDRIGAILALETGLESGDTLNTFLDRFDTGSLGVNFDPANLLMHGFEVHASCQALVSRIIHVHAHDARANTASGASQEVALGNGDIDWLALLGDLEAGDYRGWLVVEQETGDNRLEEVRQGVKFLRRLVG